MKLGAMLAELKGKQSRLARLQEISQETMYYEKGKTPKLDYKETQKEIDQLLTEIRRDKLLIMATNMTNEVGESGHVMTLATALIKLGDIRSQIAYKTKLIKYTKEMNWYEEKKEVELVPQIKEKDLEAEIKKLSDEKIKLDNEIQKANWSIEVGENFTYRKAKTKNIIRVK